MADEPFQVLLALERREIGQVGERAPLHEDKLRQLRLAQFLVSRQPLVKLERLNGVRKLRADLLAEGGRTFPVTPKALQRCELRFHIFHLDVVLRWVGLKRLFADRLERLSDWLHRLLPLAERCLLRLSIRVLAQLQPLYNFVCLLLHLGQRLMTD